MRSLYILRSKTIRIIGDLMFADGRAMELSELGLRCEALCYWHEPLRRLYEDHLRHRCSLLLLLDAAGEALPASLHLTSEGRAAFESMDADALIAALYLTEVRAHRLYCGLSDNRAVPLALRGVACGNMNNCLWHATWLVRLLRAAAEPRAAVRLAAVLLGGAADRSACHGAGRGRGKSWRWSVPCKTNGHTNSASAQGDGAFHHFCQFREGEVPHGTVRKHGEQSSRLCGHGPCETARDCQQRG